VVVDADFWPGQHALLVPHTSDGRVLFAVPWLGKVVLGTTDTPRHDKPREPQALQSELDFILREAGRHLTRAPGPQDVRSIWVGLRPLVRPHAQPAQTGAISREHAVWISPSGLVTVTGGKWTTYRAMAQDVLRKCVQAYLLDDTEKTNQVQASASTQPAPDTHQLPLVGAHDVSAPGGQTPISLPPGPHLYGQEAALLQSLPGADQELAAGLTEAMVRFAARYEYALTVEDVLARRSRLLFLDARLAEQLAPRVAQILQEETGLDPAQSSFVALAQSYLAWPADKNS
jgi:glycerol-3-phosphate dehydrogenase